MTNKILDLTSKQYKNHIFISDIHGDIKSFEGLLNIILQYYPLDGTTSLNLLGDYMDRGNYSKETMAYVMELAKHEDVYAILGNHDEMLIEWLKDPVDSPFLFNGGLNTINEFMGTSYNFGSIDSFNSRDIPMNPFRLAFKETTDFLESLPLILNYKNIIGVHAGLDFTQERWEDTSDFFCIWAREEYYNRRNNTGKYIVSGHTVVSTLNPNKISDVMHLNDNKYLIDGGSVYGGQMNALITDDNGECIQIFKTTK